MKNDIMLKASRMFNKAGLQIKKHSPEILMVAGIAGTVASTIMACKATTKIDKILEDKNYKVEKIHECVDSEVIDYTVEDSKKDLTIVYAQTGVKLAKLYAPAIALGVLSIGSIVAGQRILKKRNIALAAAYTVVDKGFKDYRKRVVERFGQEIDKELRYNIKAEEIEVKTIDENGNEVIKKEIVDNVNDPSDYSRFFDASCEAFTKSPEYNLMFLKRQQDWANEKLRSQGYLFLNDVYEMLGMQKAPYGQIVGWIYDEKNPKGDNCVDFGIYDINNESKRRFVNGLEQVILLDFNVDGNIYEDFVKHMRY